MTTMKIVVSLPRETLRRAQRAVRRGRASSLSAYVADALEQRATLDELDELLTEMLGETGGPMTPSEQKRIDRLVERPCRRKVK